MLTIDEESSSSDGSIIERDKAVESNDEPESDEPVDEFEKLEYFAKKLVLHKDPEFCLTMSRLLIYAAHIQK